MIAVILSAIMQYYYIAPFFLTLVFVFSYWLVHLMLGIFDRANIFWDWWDKTKEAFPALFAMELVYYAAILYYIVYWELSGTT